MADHEKKLMVETGEIAPEGQQGVPSKAESVESAPSAAPEVTQMAEPVAEPVPLPQPVIPSAAPAPIAVPKKDELTQEIEDILAEDLGDLYQQLPPEKRQQFKQEGEKAASLIRQMMERGKIHTRKVLGLIRRWLQLIPGVNRFFLEQESKIKTDRLLLIEEEQKQKH